MDYRDDEYNYRNQTGGYRGNRGGGYSHRGGSERGGGNYYSRGGSRGGGGSHHLDNRYQGGYRDRSNSQQSTGGHSGPNSSSWLTRGGSHHYNNNHGHTNYNQGYNSHTAPSSANSNYRGNRQYDYDLYNSNGENRDKYENRRVEERRPSSHDRRPSGLDRRTSGHGGSPAQQSNTSYTSRHTPWVHILQIKDKSIAKTIDTRQEELDNIDKELLALNQARLKLESSLDNLERSSKIQELQVQITNEKLEEFAYL